MHMMGPMPGAVLQDIVAISVPAAEVRHAQVAVESCDLVLGKGHCRLVGEPGPPPAFWATVIWNDEAHLVATVELRTGTSEPALLRHVQFASNDPLAQRYRALGLLIVSQVIAGMADTQAPAKQLPSDGRDSSPQLPWGLDVAAAAGPGLNQGPWRFGATLRGWARWRQTPWGLIASVDWSSRPGHPDVNWLTASAGALAHLELRPMPFACEFRAEFIAQRVGISAQSDQLGSDATQLPRFGGRLGADAFWNVSQSFSLFAGAWGALSSPGYVVDVENVRRGGERDSSWGLLLGLRVLP